MRNEVATSSQIVALGDDADLLRCARPGTLPLDFVDDVHPVNDPSEHDVLPVEPWTGDEGDHELGSV
jgi:hypothetical protein